jgi:2'-5' RNA ligase
MEMLIRCLFNHVLSLSFDGGREVFMRLFIAALFNEEVKASLHDTTLRLKSLAKGGTFTDPENLHLTINFIGETNRLEEVKNAMKQALDKADGENFTLSIRGFGKFKRDDGDIYWIGIEKDATLWRIQKELVKELKEAGFFDIDDRKYKPHLTIGRRITVGKDFADKEFEAGINPMQMEVSGISLMKSERVQGKLTYTEIYHIGLE